MNVVFVTQIIDDADPVLGFVPRQLQVLAEHVDRLVVIANEVHAVPHYLDAEVISLGKEDGHGQAARTLRYEAAVTRLGMRLRPATLVAHMCPIYLTVGTPAAKATGMRTLLWFVHPNYTVSLRVAERLADGVLTALPSSYPRPGPKVRVIGHAINTELFAFSPLTRGSGPLKLLALGRTSPMKGYPLMLEAVSRARAAGTDVELTIVGPSQSASQKHHRQELERLVAELKIGDAVRLEDGAAPSELPKLVSEADVVVNAHKHGSADKVVFEAMAAGRPVLVSSAAFDPLIADLPLRLGFSEGDAADLAKRMSELAAAGSDQLSETGTLLSQRVEREHSLGHWSKQVVNVCDQVHGQTAGIAARLRAPR